MSIDDLPRQMGWDEAFRLTKILTGDPSSQVCAAVNGWEHPIDRMDVVLRDLFDSFARVHYKKPEPYPRPWPRGKKRTKPDAILTQEEIIEALRNAGHDLPLPKSA